MQDNDLTKWGGHVKRARPEELDELTRTGWKVLGTFQEDVLDTASDVEVNPNPAGPNEYNYMATVCTTRTHRLRQTWFVVGVDEETTIAQQAKQIAELEQNLLEARTAQAELIGQLNSAKKDFQAASTDLEATSRCLEEARQDFAEARRGQRKLETDLGKVRQAVGDLRWREILGE